MLDDLMEIGRAEAGQVAEEPFRPATVIHETLLDALETVDTASLEGIDPGAAPDEVRARLAERGIRLEIDPAVEPGEVFQDEKKFRQILGNLIKNALRFRNERLHVRFFRNGQELIVEVSDDGPGIAPEHHELIFEPYAQVGAAHPAGRKGHGLGLAGAQTLARRLGGKIMLVSEKGEGSVFQLSVPVMRTDGR
jgi:signal transduction histidine kinase